MIKPDSPLQVGDWQYLPEQDKLVQFDVDGKIAQTAELDNLSQKVANYFIVNAGRLITKDELLQDVWGIRDVSDGRVTRVIRVLRVALGDDTREPKYIETIPKRGYRFIAPVAEVVAEHEAESNFLLQKSQPSNILFSKKIPIFLLYIFIPILGLSWYFWPSESLVPEPASIPLLTYLPVTSMDGLEFYHNVTEDERYIVYSYASPVSENIAVLMLEDLVEHKRIQLTEDTYSSLGAAFSSDFKQIAYHRYYADGRCSIRIVDFNSREFTVSSDRELTACGEGSPSSRVAWSPDSKYLIYPTMNAGRQMVLMMKPINGGAAEQLTTPPPSSFGDYAARFSFDGRKLAFVRGAGSSAQLWLLDLTSRELKMLVNVTATLPGNIGWSEDDRYVFFSSAQTAISKVDIETGLTSTVGYSDIPSQEIQTLRNGQLYASVGNFAHINIKEVGNNLRTTESASKVVFSSNRNENTVEASPIDGGPTAVVSRRSGLPQVWLFYPNGNQKQLTFFEKSVRIRRLVFAPNGEDLIVQLHNEVWLLNHNGNLTKIPTLDNTIISSPAWGAKGDSVYFSESKNGRWQINKYDVNTKNIDSSPYALDQEFYLESYDGRYSFWRDAISKKFFINWLEAGDVEELPIALPENQLWNQFKSMSSGIYYAELFDDTYYKLKFYDVKTKKILDALADDLLYQYHFSVSADEKRVFILQSVRGDIDIAKLALP